MAPNSNAIPTYLANLATLYILLAVIHDLLPEDTELSAFLTDSDEYWSKSDALCECLLDVEGDVLGSLQESQRLSEAIPQHHQNVADKYALAFRSEVLPLIPSDSPFAVYLGLELAVREFRAQFAHVAESVELPESVLQMQVDVADRIEQMTDVSGKMINECCDRADVPLETVDCTELSKRSAQLWHHYVDLGVETLYDGGAQQ